MSDKEPKKKTFKEYTVNEKSIGAAMSWKGDAIILSNGLTQKTLKELFTHGLRSITKNIKE
jgi:hypothetical protein